VRFDDGDENYKYFRNLTPVNAVLVKGDRAKVVGDNYAKDYNSHGLPMGTIVTITSVRTDRQKYEGLTDDSVTRFFVESDLEKVQQLKAGDKVTLTGGGGYHPLAGFKNGSEYVVKAMPKDHHYHPGKDLIQIVDEVDHSGFAKADQLERAARPTILTKACCVPVDERTAIIDQAKEAIRVLSTTRRSTDVPNLKGRLESFRPDCYDFVDFVVDRDKRTVVAMLKYQDDKKVWAKGISKCDPDDVFNVHLGKVIALHRALGLTVPTEYIRAPKPSEVRVGDIVKGNVTGRTFQVEEVIAGLAHGTYREDGAAARTSYYSIIDDSREATR
jgi:hypothetical protein